MSTSETLVIVAAIAGLLLVAVVPILLVIFLSRRLAGGTIANEITTRCLFSFQITPLRGGPYSTGRRRC